MRRKKRGQKKSKGGNEKVSYLTGAFGVEKQPEAYAVGTEEVQKNKTKQQRKRKGADSVPVLEVMVEQQQSSSKDRSQATKVKRKEQVKSNPQKRLKMIANSNKTMIPETLNVPKITFIDERQIQTMRTKEQKN